MRGKPEDQALITGKWFLPLRGDNTSKADSDVFWPCVEAPA